MNPSNVICLEDLPVGHEAKIVQLAGGHGLRYRLASMGLKPGIRVKMMATRGHGPARIATGDARMAIGHGMARKIMVDDSGGIGDEGGR